MLCLSHLTSITQVIKTTSELLWFSINNRVKASETAELAPQTRVPAGQEYNEDEN